MGPKSMASMFKSREVDLHMLIHTRTFPATF